MAVCLCGTPAWQLMGKTCRGRRYQDSGVGGGGEAPILMGAGEQVPRLGCRGKAPASVFVACRRGVRYSMELKALLRGELWLTFDILLGLLIGDLVLRWGLADRLMRRMMPWLRRHGIGPLVGLAT